MTLDRGLRHHWQRCCRVTDTKSRSQRDTSRRPGLADAVRRKRLQVIGEIGGVHLRFRIRQWCEQAIQVSVSAQILRACA